MACFHKASLHAPALTLLSASFPLALLRTGKLLHTFEPGGDLGGCAGLAFHPSEFLLATAAADRTAKLWDLETFELVGVTAPDMYPIKVRRLPATAAAGSAGTGTVVFCCRSVTVTAAVTAVRVTRERGPARGCRPPHSIAPLPCPRVTGTHGP